MKKIVITGALGHIGSRLIRDLPKSFPEASFVIIDNMAAKRYSSLFDLPGGVKYNFIEGDILKLELDPIFENTDMVIHLAAITDAAGSFDMKDLVEYHNFNATQKVADSCLKTGAAMVHLSSTSVYGTQNDIVDESCSLEELQPQSPYAETKIIEENYLRELCQKGLKHVIFRFGTICGTSIGMRFHTAVNKFCWQATVQKPLTVWRTALHQKRPYLTLHDAINAFKFIGEKQLFSGEIYNVLTQNLTVDDIVKNIRDIVSEIEIEYVDSEIMNQLSYEVCNRKLIDQGFVYTGSVNQSIVNTLDLFKSINRK